MKNISTLVGIAIVIVVAVLIFGGVFAYEYFNRYPFVTGPLIDRENNQTESTACTMDAKVCPDGSSVGRTGPNCEFAECPVIADETAGSALSEVEGWKTYTNKEYGFEFKYLTTWKITSIESSVDVCEGRVQGACYYDYITLGLSGDNPPVDGMFPKGCPSPYIQVSLTKKNLVGKPNTSYPDLYNQEIIKINGVNAEKLETKQTGDILIYIDKDEKTFILSLGCLSSTDNPQKYINDFDRILSTFKFIQ